MSERVIPYYTVKQVVEMAKSTPMTIIAAADGGEIKILNPHDGNGKSRFTRKLDPESTNLWLEKRRIEEEQRELKKRQASERKRGKLKLRIPEGETQLDRIERKLDQLIKNWA